MTKKFEVLEKEAVFKGYFRIDRYKLRFEKFSGEMSNIVVREVFERGIAAGVLLYDPVLDEVVLIEQFRVGVISSGQSPWLLEIVAGIIEPGETAEALAYREAREEAGLEINDLIPISHYFVSPGGTTERAQLFCGKVNAADVDEAKILGVLEEDEDIRVLRLSTPAALAKLHSGEINNAASIIALQWLELNKATCFK